MGERPTQPSLETTPAERAKREEYLLSRSLRKQASIEALTRSRRMVSELLSLLSLRCGLLTHSHQSPRVLHAVHQVKCEKYCCQEVRGNEQGLSLRRLMVPELLSLPPVTPCCQAHQT